MKSLRYIIMLVALLALVTSIVLLLNFTAPNPTGRRYSSEMPLRTGEGNRHQLGYDGERVLAKDLGLPNNNHSGQLKCLCNTTKYTDLPPNRCNLCFGLSESVANYLIPDFVDDSYIVDSKNTQELIAVRENGNLARDFQQITGDALAAQELGISLWVFTRMDTVIAPEYYDIVEATGGGIVPYFTYVGYVDPVDQAARLGVGVSVTVLVLVGFWEYRTRRKHQIVTVPVVVPAAPRYPKTPGDPFAGFDDLKESARRRVDEEDARDDFN